MEEIRGKATCCLLGKGTGVGGERGGGQREGGKDNERNRHGKPGLLPLSASVLSEAKYGIHKDFVGLGPSNRHQKGDEESRVVSEGT